MSDQATLRTIEKLGHGLAEVRHRALSQLRNKLEHGLASVEELNATPDLARRLLEWFNYPAPIEVDFVLDLIDRSVGCCGETFVQLGALQFFPALRGDLAPQQQEKCDLIMTKLEEYRHAELDSTTNTTVHSAESTTTSQKSFEFEPLANRLKKTETDTETRSAYFLGSERPKQTEYPEWFRVARLPWQTLTLNDRQVLQQTNVSLCSRNVNTVTDYCLFLGDVIFEDFPAEVFVQRPHILQSFLGFIATCPDPIHLTSALRTLTLFGRKLRDRLKEATLRDTKTEQSPGYPAGYEIGGADCWEHEPVEVLRVHETALPVLLSEVMETLGSLMKKASLETTQALSEALLSLAVVFENCVEWSLFEGGDELSSYVLAKLRSLLDWMAQAVLGVGARLTDKDVLGPGDMIHYCLLVSTLESVLKKLVPLQIVRQVAPLSLEQALQLVVFDSLLPSYSLHHDHTFSKYLATLDQASGAALSLLRSRQQSLSSARRVLDGTGTDLKIALESVEIHMSGEIIRRVILSVSQNPSESSLLLQLMSHPLQTVRQLTFVSLRGHLDETIDSISASGDSSKSAGCAFLVERPILEYLLCEACHDVSASVVSSSSKLVSVLFSSSVLWSPEMKTRLESTAYSHLAELELLLGCGDQRMATSVMEFIFAESRLPLARFKSVLRLLAAKKRDTRSDAMAQGRGLLLELFGRPMGEICDLFQVATPVDLTEQRLVDKVFRVDSVRRLGSLVKSDHIEPSLKYSAWAQLAVITADGELATLLLQDVGYSALFDQLKELSGQSGLMPEEKEAAGSMCDIIRHYCQAKGTLADQVKQDEGTFVTLVKLVELTALSPAQHRRVCALLYFLLFHEWLEIDPNGLIHAPRPIIEKLALPFCCEPIETTQLEQNDSYHPENDILANHQTAQRTLRVAFGKDMKETDQVYEQAMNLELAWRELEQKSKNAQCHGDMETVLTRATILLRTFGAEVASVFTAESDFIQELSRFVKTKPNQLRDEELLCQVLEFSATVIRRCPGHSFHSFLSGLLGDVNCPLYDYIAHPTQASREEASCRRRLITWLSRIVLCPEFTPNYGLMLQAILKRLTGPNKTTHFYDLPLVQLITKGLSRLLTLSNSCPMELLANWFHLLPQLSELISQFHAGAGESTQSFMGKSVIRNVVVAILNILRHVLNNQWVTSLDRGDSLSWLIALLDFRCVRIRASSFALISTMASCGAGLELLVRSLGDGLTARLVRVALDEGECSLVRSLALDSLTKLFAGVTKSPISNVTPLSVVEELERASFYEGMYHTLRNFSHDGQIQEENGVAPVTPILVKSFNQLVVEILKYSPRDTAATFACFNFPTIVTQIINPRLINTASTNTKRHLVEQAATTAELLSFVPLSNEMDAARFVLSFYAVNVDRDEALDAMFTRGNNFLAIRLEEATEPGSRVRLVELIDTNLEYWVDRAKTYLTGEWDESTVSFLRCLVQILVRFHQTKKHSRFRPEHVVYLTNELISRFEQLHQKPETVQVMKLRALVAACLQNLFICEKAAVTIAINSGFIERLIMDLARTQIKVALEKFRQLADTAYGQFIVLAFNLLRNAAYASEHAQIHIAKGDFPAILSRLWSHCISSDKLTRPLLQMALALTAGNEVASSRYASSNLIGQVLRQFQQFNNQIKIKIKINSLFSLIFKLLDNLSLSAEARAVFWKANLLGTFTKACDCALHTNRSKQQAVALKYWLELITKLSYHTDGQEQILAIKDILDYLCDLYQHSDDEQTLVLTIQHNLCFHVPARIRLSQHNGTLECLKAALTPDEPIRHQQLAASACWALMSSSQKAKGRIKALGFVEKLQVARTLLTEENIPLEHFNAAYELITS